MIHSQHIRIVLLAGAGFGVGYLMYSVLPEAWGFWRWPVSWLVQLCFFTIFPWREHTDPSQD